MERQSQIVEWEGDSDPVLSPGFTVGDGVVVDVSPWLIDEPPCVASAGLARRCMAGTRGSRNESDVGREEDGAQF